MSGKVMFSMGGGGGAGGAESELANPVANFISVYGILD
jgi:hypothetical protein